MVEIGQSIMITDEFYDHLAYLGVKHNFNYGDELCIADTDDKTYPGLPIRVSHPDNPEWSVCVSRLLTERARDFWVKQKELERHGEGVYILLPLAKWYAPYHELSVEERNELYRKYQAGDATTLLQISRYLEGKSG